MQSLDSTRQLRNGKKYGTATRISMSECSESSPIMNALERNLNEESESRILKQEEVDQKIRSHIAPLTK